MRVPVKTNNGLVWWNSVLAFLSYISAAGVLSNVLGPNIGALMLVIVGGLTQATGVYIAAAKPVETRQALPDPSGYPEVPR